MAKILTCLSLQGNAPIPDRHDVKLVNTNATTVYVHRFGGWALSFVVKHEIRHLALALKDIEVFLLDLRIFSLLKRIS